MRIRSHGKFAWVIKNTNKRKEEYVKKAEDKINIEEIELDSMQKDEKILALEIRVKEFQEENLKHEENLRKISKLYEMGIIDEDREFINK